MTDHERGIEAAIDAFLSCRPSQTVAVQDMDMQYRDILRQQLADAIPAYLAATEPSKPVAEAVKVPVRFLFDRTDLITGETSEEISKVDRSGEPGITNVRPLYGEENVRSSASSAVTEDMIAAAESAYWHEVHNGDGYSEKCYEAAIRAALAAAPEAKP